MSDVSAVIQLILRERQGRDRGWWEQMRDAYAADSVVDMSWFQGSGHEFVRRSQFMAESPDGWNGHSVHRITVPAVHIHGDRAWAEVPVTIEFRIMIGGVEADLVSYCRNQYRAAREASRVWRIVRLTSIYERDALTPVLPGAALPVTAAELVGRRPSYRYLAWYHALLGLPLRENLLGDDRPAAVARQYDAEHEWLKNA
ncbi:nuclear transport factor 2 family protein [Mycobacterium sp. 236(2023)]|uniref:nuclear transport factor 2 family protein n=1 Tax=Mycobacterium sp. 236(2023) TaxID=3038163 RepID=UPI0024153C89|nr:nuclear transport factor 2 family protein [Mycobacterium sp. 236(2023)]MDG4668034.1 nuclear transport factor 2 family protein [Mycobacterium sp. 236(2023)]